MKKMLYFELKKIFERKLNYVAMIMGYGLIIFCGVYFILSCTFYDGTTGEYVKGISGIHMSQQKNNALTEYLTDDYLLNVITEVQEKDMDFSNDEGFVKVILPMNDLFWLVCSNYADVGEPVDWNRLNEIPLEEGMHFYQQRVERVSQYLNMDFSYGNYSKQEKDYWLEKMEKVKTPFLWGDKTNMDIVWDTVQLGFYLIFVVVICIAPIFASEYESGAAALLLTTKNGKSRLIYAKILAAVLFSVMYVLLGVFAAVSLIGLMIGFHGAKLPVQLWGTVIPYDWNIGATCIISLLILLLVALAMALFASFLSSRLKGSMVTLVLCFMLILGPAFLPMSKNSGFWNHINYLFPIRVISMKDVLRTFNSYQFGPVVISYLGMIAVVYVILALLCLLGIKNGFARHQVKN